MIRNGQFVKATDSERTGCLEVAALPSGGVQIRDTKNREGGTQTYTDREWRAFIAGAKRGEFDLPD